jgi:hypothetical protein
LKIRAIASNSPLNNLLQQKSLNIENVCTYKQNKKYKNFYQFYAWKNFTLESKLQKDSILFTATYPPSKIKTFLNKE